MKKFAIDTNILVYAHNNDSYFHEIAKDFIETVMNERDENGDLQIGIPAQVFIEFISVVTSKKLENPLSLSQASAIVQDYIDMEIMLFFQKETYLANFLELLGEATSRKQIFDVAIVATLKDNNVFGIYTANVSDFKKFSFLEVINPLE